MKSLKRLRRGLAFVVALTISISMMQPLTANAASTTEKKATVKFSETKASGFKKITDLYTYADYVVALGTKKSGNVLSYSKDGMTFQDVDLDKVIEKEYTAEKLSNIKLSTYLGYIDKNKYYYIIGSGTTTEDKTYHFMVTVSKDLKDSKVIKLDTAVAKLDANADGIQFEQYANFDYNSGVMLLTGSYMSETGTQMNFYVVSKNGTDIAAYAFPDASCNSIDIVGKYLIAYNYTMKMNDSSQGEFYYSTDYKTWKKGTTPSADGTVSWNRSYYDYESFCASTNDYSSDTGYVYYTSNMKDYKSISKKYVVTSRSHVMEFNNNDNKIYAVEQGFDETRQLVISIKSGSKWKELFNYTAKSNDFDYYRSSWIDGGLVFVNDGGAKTLFKYASGKQYKTSIDSKKLNLYGNYGSLYYGTYDNQYILASKNGLVKNYLMKTPEKINGMSVSDSKNRLYIFSDTAIYYVPKDALNNVVK